MIVAGILSIKHPTNRRNTLIISIKIIGLLVKLVKNAAIKTGICFNDR